MITSLVVHVSRDPNYDNGGQEDQEEDDDYADDDYDYATEVDYDNMNFYGMEMYPSPMYSPMDAR